MEYNEKIAREIIERFNLSPTTLLVWKTRGKVPKKYFSEDFKPRRVTETKAEKLDYERGMQVFQSEKIAIGELLSRTNIPKNAYFDAIRPGRKVELDYNQFIKLKKELQRFRIKTKAVVEKLAVKDRFTVPERKEVDEILTDELIVLAQLFNYEWRLEKELQGTPVSIAYQRVSSRRTRAVITHEDWEVTLALDKLSVFLIETAL